MKIKPTAFSGSWYPATAGECESAIQGYLKQDRSGPAANMADIIGGIVPHAGWVYSGTLACRVIASMVSFDNAPDTIVLFGAHMHASSPGFMLASGGVDTPFGVIEVDEPFASAVADALAEEPFNPLSPARFPDENTLELQYPFIRHFFPGARILVCGVPPSDLAGKTADAVVAAATSLGRGIRIIGSTDMTHYGPNFGFEPAGSGGAAVDWVKTENDAHAIKALAAMDDGAIISQGLNRRNMCCAGAAAATVLACKKMGAVKGTCLDYASSYDISRSSSFVGYCGMVYSL